MDLKEYITKDYIYNTKFFREQNTLIPVKVLVEGDDDIEFWKKVLSKYNKYNFSIATNKVIDSRGTTTVHNGKDALMKWASLLCENFIICVDADYDLVIDNYHSYTNILRDNKYIINTAYYSIENVLCHPDNLTKIEKELTTIDSSFNYLDFLELLSSSIYDLLLLFVAAKNESIKSQTDSDFTIMDFKRVVNSLKFRNNTYSEDFKAFSDEYHNDNALKLLLGKYKKAMKAADVALCSYNCKDKNAYKLIQGHFLFDRIVFPVLCFICSTIRGCRTQIKDLYYNCTTFDDTMIPDSLERKLNDIYV
ncbi:ABC transporter ATP-binding protein [Prevotella herbatica]|uniref:ABC transporter ATP-binding protein n=1 Tax=Prevotella herbatica TaxID=2801997 RepID=A0ABN6EIJ4_9BACT|nr:DUF4435 domain-containing protein [Prevotella herbatica]BCS85755.1 ABC transporter ATP-binding protein [Prevotella herbatica]